MENAITGSIHHVLFLLILIFGLGMLFGKAASWLKLPDVALFLIAGMIVGKGLHLVSGTDQVSLSSGILDFLKTAAGGIALGCLRSNPGSFIRYGSGARNSLHRYYRFCYLPGCFNDHPRSGQYNGICSTQPWPGNTFRAIRRIG
ncbi:putative membrane protein [Paenibacillus larvae subsp. larvae]|uniref:Putative membrane protein n=1 Tax=Paenibacillus larvae subsp. larvae TaxID=147375 RepID=A0A2L1U4L8_9BACL|nr:putative membrane protein [Paenibacillus larvae subsp. larvae]AVF32363.1 putative membrane protein [Paenibacillus larvae subsp. larvae]MBH0341491.1 hypothetical protein [Paenibacillus larvae]